MLFVWYIKIQVTTIEYLMIIEKKKHILQLRNKQQESSKHPICCGNTGVILLVWLDDEASKHCDVHIHQSCPNY